MAYRVIRPATHQEWLDERKKGIGSSEAGTVMGVNHFDTPYKLWRRKTGVDDQYRQARLWSWDIIWNRQW